MTRSHHYIREHATPKRNAKRHTGGLVAHYTGVKQSGWFSGVSFPRSSNSNASAYHECIKHCKNELHGVLKVCLFQLDCDPVK